MAAGGFVVAALWIDTIATELVSIIEYLGLLSGINHTVGLVSRCFCAHIIGLKFVSSPNDLCLLDGPSHTMRFQP